MRQQWRYFGLAVSHRYIRRSVWMSSEHCLKHFPGIFKIQHFLFQKTYLEYVACKQKLPCIQNANDGVHSVTSETMIVSGHMMTSSNGTTCYWPFVRGIHSSPLDSPHKGQWCGALMFLWSAPEQTVEETIETPVIRDAISLWRHCNEIDTRRPSCLQNSD